MDPDSWNRIKELVSAVRDLPTTEREVYLDDACGDDPEVRREVDSLLAADLDAAAFVEEPMLRLLDEPAGRLKEGDQIGAYAIRRELGRGGMGVVYLATRADAELERQVAIKVLRPGMEREEIYRRFRQEIQILANLKHPNIAQLYDVDRTADGRLYFRMEYIDGDPIDVYCRKQKLSVTQRLELFREVCAAVQHAHQQLVVHRDLKPSNILVGADRVPKLLDFGVAKLLDEADGSDSLTMTTTGLQPLTPVYASPEQLLGRQITTASDVFSLGVVLYELLVGIRPFRPQRRAADEIKRVICEEDPEKPSTAVGRAQEKPQPDDSTNTRRPVKASDIRRLQRQLEGDLDTIVLMALRKETDRRYSSVAEFSEDIERHLSGLPVRAQKDTWLYRTGKYVRRNLWRVAAVLLLVGLSAAFLVNNFFYQKQLERERDKFRYIADFLVNVFRVSDPSAHSEGDPTARVLLDQAAQRIAATAQEPEIRADLAQTIGMVYVQLGLYQEGKELLGEALGIRRDIFGARHEAVAEALYNHGVALKMLGHADEAIRDLKTSVEIRKAKGPRGSSLAESLSELAHAHYVLHANYQEAERLQLEALDIRQRSLGSKSVGVAESLNYLGLTYKDQQRYAEAESVFTESYNIYSEIHGPDSVQAATPMHNLALVYRAQGRFEEAEEHHRRSLAILEAAYGLNNPAVATGLNVLGLFLTKQERFQEALPIYQRSLEIRQSELGDEHPSTVLSFHNLGSLYLAMGDLEKASQILEKALSVRERILPQDHPSLGASLFKLATLRMEQTQYADAERLFKRTIALLESINHPRLATVKKKYAELLRIVGREQEAAIQNS